MNNSSIGIGTSNNSYGQFWYGGNKFPGFYFKKNNGVGSRKSTQFTPGGTIICNQPNEFWNKYKPGTGGVGASTTSNRRAKNRHATICTNQRCFPCYMTLGQYSNYTHNPNGYYNCINNKSLNLIPRPIPTPTPTPTPYNPYQIDAYWATFRGNNPDLYGRTKFLGPIKTPRLKYSYNVFDKLNSNLSGSCVIDKNGNVYTLTSNSFLLSFNTDLTLRWVFDPQTLNFINYSPLFTPVISLDGTIYFATNIKDSQNNIILYNKLFAINPDGTKKWDIILQNSLNVDGFPYMILLSKEENIFVITHDTNNVNSYVNIINKFGQIINQITFNNIYLGGWNMSLSMNTDELYITGYNGNISLYTINYKKNISKEVILSSSQIPFLFSIPLKLNEYIYIGSNEGIYKINSITNNIVKQNPTDLIFASSPCIDNEENFYVGVTEQQFSYFIKFDKNLNKIWSYNFNNSSFDVGSPLISQDKYIYLTDTNNNLLICLDKDNGSELWNVSISGNNIICNPCIGKNNLIYVIGGDIIQAFGT